MEVPTEPEPGSPKGTPVNIVFHDVPSHVAKNLKDVLTHNPDARKALLLFLQDSGVLLGDKELTWENPHIKVTIPESELETSYDDH